MRIPTPPRQLWVPGPSSHAAGALRSETVRTDGAVLLKGLLEPERLRNIRRAYRPVLTARIDRAGPDRGPERYYATPPFVPPFFDPKIFQHPDILGIVRRLVGEEPVMCQWAADTPLPGSEYQEVPPPKVSLAPGLPPFRSSDLFAGAGTQGCGAAVS